MDIDTRLPLSRNVLPVIMEEPEMCFDASSAEYGIPAARDMESAPACVSYDGESAKGGYLSAAHRQGVPFQSAKKLKKKIEPTRPKKFRSVAWSLVLVCLLACCVVGVLALAGVLDLGIGRRNFAMNSERWPYEKSKHAVDGANFPSNTDYPVLSHEPRSEANHSENSDMPDQPSMVQVGEDKETATTKAVVITQTNITLVDFTFFRLDSLSEAGESMEMLATVNADYADYVIFRNLSCHSGAYYGLVTEATSPTLCGGLCVNIDDCQAWTFTESLGVCHFARECDKLGRQIQGVTGVKRRTSDGAASVVHIVMSSESKIHDVSRNSAGKSADNWIIFQNMGSSGGSYRSLIVDSASECSLWCGAKSDCHAWTYSASLAVCNFKGKHLELTTEGNSDVSGIRSDAGGGGIAVSFNGGSKQEPEIFGDNTASMSRDPTPHSIPHQAPSGALSGTDSQSSVDSSEGSDDGDEDNDDDDGDDDNDDGDDDDDDGDDDDDDGDDDDDDGDEEWSEYSDGGSSDRRR